MVKSTTAKVKFVPDVKDGKIIGLVIGFRNADADHEYQEKLETALADAKAASNAKSTFLFNMSHDIRTPMNAITGFTTMAKKSIDDPIKTADYLEKIETAGNQLLRLINQVLEMSRIESGKIVLANEAVNVVEKVKSKGIIFEELCREKNIDLTVNIHDVKHENIISDSDRIDQILLNLIGNSYKYTLVGGKIYVSLTQNEINEDTVRNTIVISDNGVGMSKEFVEHIFDEFARETTSTISKIEGTGLGMSIVKKLVELMNGKIDIQSEKGTGTTITVTLENKYDDSVISDEDENFDPSSVSFDGVNILLVEDNALNREIAIEILSETGAKITTAEDGDIAVDLIKNSTPGDFDLILMDIQMPRMNGYDATKAIRNLEDRKLARIPIIAMTANAFEEDKKNAMNAGMNAHLAKPIDIKKTVKTISKYIKKTLGTNLRFLF